MHTDVRLLSKGKVLTRIHELQKELNVFFDKEKHEKFCKYLRCYFWMAKMEYLAEIFGQLNINNITNCTKEMIPIVVGHLTALEENIDHYFPSLNTEKYDWVRNPVIDVPSNIGLK